MTALRFADFDDQQRADWLSRSLDLYAQESSANDGMSYEDALAQARDVVAAMFPGGVPAAGHQTGYVLWNEEVVGELWIGPRAPGTSEWWVWNIEIVPERRREGLGRRTMSLAEELAEANGATSIGLNVFAHNVAARRLYTSLNYEVTAEQETAVQMRKALGTGK